MMRTIFSCGSLMLLLLPLPMLMGREVHTPPGLQRSPHRAPEWLQELSQGAVSYTIDQSVSIASTGVANMRFPCAPGSDIPCFENVDVIRQPQPPPAAPDINISSHELMPWSPFPCSVAGTADPRQKSDYCYDLSNAADPRTPDPSLGSHDLATSLTYNSSVDFFAGRYLGKLPAQLSTGVDLPDIKKLLVTANFSIAYGLQYDRAYSVTFGGTKDKPGINVMKGTTAQPFNGLYDKFYVVTVDVTHLLPALTADMPVSFALGNAVWDFYDVPIWASLTLDVYYATTALPAGVSPYPLGFSTDPSVPTMVVPLEPAWLGRTVSANSTSTTWPSKVWTLPVEASKPGGYRAQLLLQGSGYGCEEFWPLHPSGTKCGGYTTGQPYKEFQVYVDGFLAAFTTPFYSPYTGHLQPRLWQTIVAPHAFALPTYRLDITPFMGLLNNPAANHTIEILGFGITNDGHDVTPTLLLWHDETRVVTGPRPTIAARTNMRAALTSVCTNRQWTGTTCTLRVRNRGVTVRSELVVTEGATSSALQAFSSYSVTSFTSEITYLGRAATWRHATRGQATWSLRHRTISSRTVTKAKTAYSWLYKAKTPIVGSTWELSNNATSGQYVVNTLAAVVSNQNNSAAINVAPQSQKHYQRILVPSRATQKACERARTTVTLASAVPTFTFAPEATCLTQNSTCSFCYLELLSNTLGTCAARVTP